MFSISIFNNKGGVGKTTLAYHFAHALGLLGHKVLVVDLDPQCNLTILALNDSKIYEIWDREGQYIDDFSLFEGFNSQKKSNIILDPRSVHFLLKPTEDGLTDFEGVSAPVKLADRVWILPGRLTLHSYEDKIGERWANAYKGDPLAIRTITQIRTIALRYASEHSFDYVIFDTSPSLGMLNRVVLSMADGFIIPCLPDKFSLYGIRNIGAALKKWKSEFDIVLSLQSPSRKSMFPGSFVKFLGYTIYNARPYKQNPSINKWDLANGHYNFARQIPETIKRSIPEEIRAGLSDADLDEPIGGTNVMHTHNTLPNVSQKYHMPIWELPNYSNLEQSDRNTIRVNQKTYESTRDKYLAFAQSVVRRVAFI